MKTKLFLISLLFSASLLAGISIAQNKVVVIPLIETSTAPPGPVPKTGAGAIGGYILQDGEDGNLKNGVKWPNPRFIDNGNGTVTDKLTGLIWLKEGQCSRYYFLDVGGDPKAYWDKALARCNQLASGYCDLTDGSTAGDWRLPNRKELESLIDLGRYDPALPLDCPLAASTASSYYWSSTSVVNGAGGAWYVHFWSGTIEGTGFKDFLRYVRAVRGGK